MLVGDETAVPALRAILRHADPEELDRLDVHVEVSDARHAVGLDGHDVHLRGGHPPGFVLLKHLADVLTEDRMADIEYGWACGESALATGVRRMLVGRGLHRRSVFYSAFWRVETGI